LSGIDEEKNGGLLKKGRQLFSDLSDGILNTCSSAKQRHGKDPGKQQLGNKKKR
jgi:hypothetical protein